MSQLRTMIEGRLVGDSTLSAALGSTTLATGVTTKSIFYDHLPESLTINYPLIVYWTVDSLPKPTNVKRVESERWQFDINATTLTTLETLVQRVIDLLDGWGSEGTTFAIYRVKYSMKQKPIWDDELKLWSQSVDFLVGYAKK